MQDQRHIARPIVLTAAILVLLMIPALQGVERVAMDAGPALWWRRLIIRGPLVVLAVAVLVMYRRYPDGRWPRPLALGLAAVIVGTGLATFWLHLSANCPDIHYVVYTLTMALPAVAVLATRGLRDLFPIYLLPLLLFVLLGWWLDVGLPREPSLLAYPLLAMLMGAVIAEMLHRSYRQTFAAHQQLAYSASTDVLTQLPNRRAAETFLAVEHARALRSGTGYAAIMADLDHFKRVNDRYGHDVGDEVLAELAERLRAAVRAGDQVTRWGGEEFLVLLPEADVTGARDVAEKLRASVAAAPFPTSAGMIETTISLGIAVHGGESRAAQVVQRADAALYRAKQAGRNRAVLAGSED